MYKSALFILTLLLIVPVAPPAWSQSIQTDDDIETSARLVSTVPTGTAPLVVSSSTLVPDLNADQVDGMEASAFALEADLQNVEALLAALGTAPVPRTGQATCYDESAVAACGAGIGLGQDGHLQVGVTWLNPRFTNNADGTVKDNLTGLVWLQEANCFGTENWTNALAKSNALFDGCTDCEGTDNDCGLSDGSTLGQWRLPNIRELRSLLHYGVTSPAIPNTAGTARWTAGDPFVDLASLSYWTSTSVARLPQSGWTISLAKGRETLAPKSLSGRVWPVRDEQ